MGCGSSAAHRPDLAALSPKSPDKSPESLDDTVRYQKKLLVDLRLQMVDPVGMNTIDQLQQLLDRHTTITRTAISGGEDMQQQLDLTTRQLREAEKQAADANESLQSKSGLEERHSKLSACSPLRPKQLEMIPSLSELHSRVPDSKLSKGPLQQLNGNGLFHSSSDCAPMEEGSWIAAEVNEVNRQSNIAAAVSAIQHACLLCLHCERSIAH